MNEKTLVILAAGMGSRFGSPKQIYPVGPNGEFIMDYSIYSALKYGFNKVVLVIRKEMENEFKNTIGKRLENIITINYAYQDLNNLPHGYKAPEEREKPWGTAHALYCAKDVINSNFAVISADDFYGDESFKLLSSSLDNNEFSVIGYKVGETLSENGAVKRGVVISNDGIIKKIIESECTLENDAVKCTPLNKSINPFFINKDNSVSMLMNGFTPEILDVISNKMIDEFENHKEELMHYEMLLPDMMMMEIEKGRVIKDIPTSSTWVGMTYKEDAILLKNHISKLINDGIYPNNLWTNDLSYKRSR